MFHENIRGFVRKIKSKKKLSILLVSLVFMFAASFGGTLAYLLDTTSEVTNTFTPAEVEIKIDEETTPDTKSEIKFVNASKDENSNAIPVYIRATLAIYWTETVDGTEQVIAPPKDSSVSGGGVITANGWFQVGDIYYYKYPVDPGDATKVMLEPITVENPDGSKYTCNIDVRAEALQAEPRTAVKDAWMDVNVEFDTETGSWILAAANAG